MPINNINQNVPKWKIFIQENPCVHYGQRTPRLNQMRSSPLCAFGFKICISAHMISNGITLENQFGVENADFLLIQKPQKIAKESKRNFLPEKWKKLQFYTVGKSDRPVNFFCFQIFNVSEKSSLKIAIFRCLNCLLENKIFETKRAQKWLKKVK